MQLYLQRWGMTPQKPLARARERQPAAIAAWLEKHYPAIARRAKAEGAAIYWGDETGITNQDQIGRSYAPRGQTPVVRRTAKRITQSMISAVSNRGLMRFMLYEGALNADRFIAFLRRLSKDAGQKVFLIVDNLKVHHAAKVTTWVAAHAHEIELFYLPAYAPDHNPDEYLNNDLKQKLRQQPQPAIERRADQEHPCGPARHPALTSPHPGLLHATAGPLCRLNVWYNVGILVSGGGAVNVAMVRDLGHVVDREKAKIGVFITLTEPTGPMKTEAIKAGFFETPWDKFPKLQIVTIAELFDGKKPQIHSLTPTAFRKTAKEDASRDQQGGLF